MPVKFDPKLQSARTDYEPMSMSLFIACIL